MENNFLFTGCLHATPHFQSIYTHVIMSRRTQVNLFTLNISFFVQGLGDFRSTTISPSLLFSRGSLLNGLLPHCTLNPHSFLLKRLQTKAWVDYIEFFVPCQPCGWHMLMVWGEEVVFCKNGPVAAGHSPGIMSAEERENGNVSDVSGVFHSRHMGKKRPFVALRFKSSLLRWTASVCG